MSQQLLSCFQSLYQEIRYTWTNHVLKTYRSFINHVSSSGLPVKAEDLPMKRGLTDDYLTDLRPVKYRNKAGFLERAVNIVFNYCAMTSDNLTFRYLYSKSDMKSATLDHDYIIMPITEYWIDNEAISHGKVYESKAISSFEAYTGPKVQRCGLFLCVQRPYLGALPDCLVLNESVIEVKCPYTGRHQ